MRASIVIDDQLVADAMKLSGAKTKREVVELALRRLVASAKQKDILDLVGQDMIAPDYDVRAVRSRMGNITLQRNANSALFVTHHNNDT